MSREELRALASAGRFEAAAELAESLGLALESAGLWERACRFERAARAYLAAGAPDKALPLAARIEDRGLVNEALRGLASNREAADAALVRLEAARHFDVAARLSLMVGNAARAGELYEWANRPLDAAKAYQAARLPKPAARVLERAQRDAALPEASYMLARLYRRSGEREAAVRTLQRSLLRTGERQLPLAMLTDLLVDLNLAAAARETRERLSRLSPSSLPDPWGSDEGEPEASETLLFGRYVVTERVARSATATVYRADDRATGEAVAVKLFSPTLTTGAGRDAFYRFEREVNVLRDLAHPFVVPLHAYHREGPAVVLRWMSGGSLAERLERGSESPAGVVAALTRVLEVLAEAHRRGILHRDIKPDNILFDGAGAAFLADFGTAHVADHAQTVTQGVLGTLAYMAPEQRRGEKATIASDIYSVGAVLWHALSGAPPNYERSLEHPGITEQHARIARALLGAPAFLESADRARELIVGVEWPTSPTVRRPTGAQTSTGPRNTVSVRLKPGPGGSYIDDVLERPVDIAPYQPDLLDRARAFASAAHANLARIYRFDPKRREVWVEHLMHRRNTDLTAEERSKLAEALAALHHQDGYHGAVDARHVGWRDSEPILAFPKLARPTTLTEDLKALDEL